MSLLWIPGRLPGLNELIEARMQRGKGLSTKGKRWSQYSDIKRQCEERIALCARSQRFAPNGKHFNYLFVEGSQRRDPSNISAGAVKMVEDGLQKAKLLDGDGWKHVEGDTRYFHHDKLFEGVCLIVQDCPVLSKNAMLQRLHIYVQKGCVNHG